MLEIRIDIDEEKHKQASQKERDDFLCWLFDRASIATADYGAQVDFSDCFHWVIKVPESNEGAVRQLLGIGQHETQ